MIGFPASILLVVSHARYDKDMSCRAHHALQATAAVKLAVEDYHRENGRWPASDIAPAELGAARRHACPDGGYYELEDDGRIRIRLEIEPALKKGSIVVVSQATESGCTGTCRHEGAIAKNHLPSVCRD